MFQALRSNRWYVPLITIGAFVVLFGVYYFVYVSWQRNYANDRSFRLLSVVGDQLGKKFTNLKSVISAALAPSPLPGAPSAAEYLAGVPTYKGQISVIESQSPCPSGWNRQGDMTLKLVENTGNLALRVTFQAAGLNKYKSPPCFLTADVVAGLDLTDRFHDLIGDYFDDLLIATSTGEVLFESNPSGIRITSLSALVNPSNPGPADKAADTIGPAPATFTPFQRASQFSNVVDVQLAGAAYKLYVQPVPLPILRGDQTVIPVVCGLWRTDRLQSEVVSIPYATIIWIALIALAIFGLLWPLLKVVYMSPAERLKRAHVFYLLFSALFVTTILATIILNLAYSVLDHEEAREQVKALADRIDTNVKAELARALALMNTVERDDLFFRLRLRAANPKDWTDSNILVKLRDTDYPYFDNMFWADAQGAQVYKMTVRASPTPQTSVAAELFFQDARDCRHLTTLNGSDPGDCGSPAAQGQDASSTPFRFDSLYSPNTGEFIAVIAKPHQGTAGDGLDRLKAQVLVTKFVSLVDPVIPAGFGFAVVDHDGLVQFHSSSARNHIENFFKECRQDAALKALVVKGARDYAEVDYTGRRQLMLVRPLPYLADPALTLIVFRDTNYFTTVNVACMLVFAIFVGMLSLPWLVGLALFIFRGGDYPLGHLWPSAVQNATYVRIIAANVCLAAAFALCFSSMSMQRILWSSLAVAAAGAFFGLVRPKWAKERRSLLGRGVMLAAILGVAQWSLGLLAAAAYCAFSVPRIAGWFDRKACDMKVRYLYLGAVLSLLIVAVVFPAFGVFKIAYQSVNRLALESAQLGRLDLLTHRADDIREYFATLQADSKLPRQRIEEDLDRYDRAVFLPVDPGEQSRSDQPLTRLEMWIAAATGWFPANDFGSELRQMAMADADGSGPHWVYRRGTEDEVLMLRDGVSRKVVREGELKGVYPIWMLPRKTAVLIVVLTLLLAVWLSHLIRKVFLTDLAKVPPLTPWRVNENGARNLLVVGHPKSGKRTRAAALADAQMLDLAEIVTSENWMLPKLAGGIVVIDHFEFDIDNPDTLFSKLKLLEQLLYVEKKRIVLLSAVDPMFYLAASTPEIMSPGGVKMAPAQLLDRWAMVLSAFDKRQMEDVTESYINRYLAERGSPCLPELIRLVKLECDHTAELRRLGLALLEEHCGQTDMPQALFVEELLDRADTYYRVLWSNCTREERLVLFQLARDGWANPKNDRAIQQLERRRLVRRAPGLRIMNESFCRFIHMAQLPSEVAAWEDEQQHSTWSAVKTGLTTAVFMAGAWLLYTQQDIFQLGLGYVAALGTATGVVLNLARNFTGKKAAPKAGEGA